MHRFGFSQKISQKLVDGLEDKQIVEKECELIERHSVQIATFGSEGYPEMLTHIYAPPPVLYWLGESVFNRSKTIAVIGSRCAHRYGEQVIEDFIPQLVNNGWVIVSGGAIGADSMAHRTTVQSGGKTVVVLGSGILRPYPASNEKLFDSILDSGGALVSSFPLKTQARPGNFPARNRIIAGLSRGCVVVQAAQKSGARITAQFALEQGREVFAVPGPIGDVLSAGCHGLIQEGAKLVSCADDIIAEFGISLGSVAAQSHKRNTKVFEPRRSPKKVCVSSCEAIPQPKGPAGAIIFACKQPCSIDDIAVKTGVEMEQLHAILFELQVSGQIRQNFAGLWERAI